VSLNRPPRRAPMAGYALLEALVAVIVTSIGFIGAARLQTLGMSFNNGAVYRQKATLLGYQMTDRMRANQAGMLTGAYDNPTPGSTACLATGCSPTALAAADAAEWAADIASQLPEGSGVVCIDSTPEDGTAAAPACDGIGRVMAVKVWWTDTLGANRFVTVARP
jgi:type IV pilus assembly protein PilV